jgi:two-component system, chemotaxis family, sensor kinase CheA
MSEYMPMFMAEAREHLQELNLAVVHLEEEPTAPGAIDGIFRAAHSLKGMSATMGFDGLAALTHEMENVFELLRQRRDGVTREAIDAVLACLDALSDAVDSIEESGEERLDPAPLVERLRGLVRARQAPQAAAAPSPEDPAIQAAREEGRRVVQVVCELDPGTAMPAVRAHMVLEALDGHGDLLVSTPDPAAVEHFDGRTIEAWLATEEPRATIEHSLSTIGEVTRVLTHLDDEEVPGAEPAADAGGVDPDAVETVAREETGAAGAGPAPERSERSGSRAHAARTVRVDPDRLDLLMHHVGELVVHRTAVEALAQQVQVPELHQAVQNLTRSSQALQAMVMQVRMIPVEAVFLRFPRLVRDLQSKLGKEVELVLTGQDTEVDRSLVDALGDPLVHLVRNSIDHGLEPPDERTANGKSRHGRLEIAARHGGGCVIISVRDDGRGIDPARVADVAVTRGLIEPEQAEDVDMARAIELLFAPGFSTAAQTSDLSGRGVGMDAVQAKVRELGGEVVVESATGEGTFAQIRLPLTLAIVSALLVDVAGAPLALPIDRIERTLRIDAAAERTVSGCPVLALSDGVVPLLDAGEAVGGLPAVAPEYAVIVSGAGRRVALAVDELVGQRELVTRALPPQVGACQALAGGAVLADGRIALIVDCDGVVARADARNNSSTGPVPTVALAA